MKMDVRQPSIVGFSGYGRSGKDTCLRLLNSALAETGLQKHLQVALAKPVKEDLLMCTTRIENLFYFSKDRGNPIHQAQLKELLRELYETYATKIVRKLDPEAWIKLADTTMKYAEAESSNKTPLRWGFSYVRYINEALFVERRGGVLFLVTRPGQTAKGECEEEGAREIANALASGALKYKSVKIIVNNCGEEELRKRIFRAYIDYCKDAWQ
jgi:hypothetical protein